MSSVLRSTTFQLEVKNSDGTTQIRKFTRAVKDADKVTEELNSTLGDNVKVTYETKRSTAELTKEARMQITQFERAERKIAELTRSYQLEADMIGKTALEQQQLNAVYQLGNGATEAQKRQIMELVAANHALTASQGVQQGSLRDARGIMQNFGWQMQDTIVQLQMGTSGFIVFSQQASQMASAFGPGGAVLGAIIALAGVVGGTLYTAFQDTKVSSEELTEAQKFLSTVLEQTDGSADKLSKTMEALAVGNEQLAELKLRRAIVETNKVIDDNKNKMKELISEYSEFEASNLRISSKYEQYDEFIEENSKKLGINAEQLKTLIATQKNAASTGGEWRDSLQNLLVEYSRLPGATPALIELAEKSVQLGDESSDLEERIRSLTDAIENGLTNSLDEASSKAFELTSEFNAKTMMLGLTEREQALYNAQVELGIDASGEERKALELSITTYYDKKDAIEKAAEAERNANREREANARAATAAERRRQREAETERKRIQREQWREDQQAADHMKRLREKEDERFRNEVENMRRAMDAKIDLEENFAQRKDDINRALQEGYLTQEQAALQSLINQSEYNAQLVNLYASGISSAASYVLSMADTMVNGAENAKNATKEMNAFQKALWLTTQIGLAAKAYMDGVSLGMSLAAMFPIAAPAMVLTGQALGAASAGMIMGTSFAGAFDNGGYIPSNSMGIVSEYGDELVNGQLIKGPARVTSREDTAKLMNGGSLNVQLINQAPGVDHQVQQIDAQTVRIIAKQVFDSNIDKGVSGVLTNSRTRSAKAVQSTTKAGRKV